VAVGFSSPGRPVDLVPADVSARGGRWRFHARAPLPQGLGGTTPIAVVETDKGRALLRGSRLERHAPPEGSPAHLPLSLASPPAPPWRRGRAGARCLARGPPC